jgi:hypothetical protein
MWIPFQYERLSWFCFNCGVVKHGPLGCMKKPSSTVQGEGTEYGSWPRAPPPDQRIRGGSEWMRRKVGYAHSHNGCSTGYSKERGPKGRKQEFRSFNCNYKQNK